MPTNHIINATSTLKNSLNFQTIEDIAYDLRLIKSANLNIDFIIVRGGCAVDVISGIEPNDVDLFYSYKTEKGYCEDCICEEVRKTFKNLDFKYFKSKEIDLENSYEKEPRLSPIERTCGLFSYHSDYNSMFAIEESGEVWTNKESLNYHLNNTYEVRYEGALPWAYFPAEGDSNNYYSSLVYKIIRGLGYIIKRKLIIGSKFMDLIKASPYLVEMGIKAKNGSTDSFKRYSGKKIGDFAKVEKLFENYDLESEREKIIEALRRIV